jgi:hypothetical protein
MEIDHRRGCVQRAGRFGNRRDGSGLDAVGEASDLRAEDDEAAERDGARERQPDQDTHAAPIRRPAANRPVERAMTDRSSTILSLGDNSDVREL